MRDFTFQAYIQFLKIVIGQDYQLQTFSEFIKKPADRVVILRHDVDDRNRHALKFAQIQNDLGVKGSYYFRMVPNSFDEKIIREIASMGHEIGYHYEELRITQGDFEKSYELAKKNIAKLREIATIETICMHGSPRSTFDNRDLWKRYDYHELGIIGEPYFDVNFNNVLYLTDTGRRWDGNQFSIRDKVESEFRLKWRSTHEIVQAFEDKQLPDQIMFNFHPQRWTDNYILWLYEFFSQNAKNFIKRMLITKVS